MKRCKCGCGKKIIKICLVCDKEFQVYPSHEDQKCCSIECKRIYQTGEKITKICLVCDKKFQVIPSLEHQKCCSIKCRGIYRAGENHPGWNHNLTNEHRQHTRQYPEYKEWRNTVLKRDNYTCQKCFKLGGKLTAHHLESYADNPELRTTLSNGVTLCETCHNNFHHIYGNGNNTKSDFLEWRIYMQITIEKEFYKHSKKLRELGFHVDANRAHIDVTTAARVPFYIRKIRELRDINRIYIEGISQC